MPLDFSALPGQSPKLLEALGTRGISPLASEGGLLDRALGYTLGAVPEAAQGITKAAGNLFGFDGQLFDPSTDITPASSTSGKIVDFVGNLLPLALQYETGAGPVGALAKATGLTAKAPVVASALQTAAGFGLVGEEQGNDTGASESGIGALIGASHGLPLPARIPASLGLGLLSKAIFESRHPEAGNGNTGTLVGAGNLAAALFHRQIGGKAKPFVQTPEQFATVAKGGYDDIAAMPAVGDIDTHPVFSEPDIAKQVGYQPTKPMIGVPEVVPRPTSLQSISDIESDYLTGEPIVRPPEVLPATEPAPALTRNELYPEPIRTPMKTTPKYNPLAIPRMEESGGIGAPRPDLPETVPMSDLPIDTWKDHLITAATRGGVGALGGALLAGPDATPQSRMEAALGGAAALAAAPYALKVGRFAAKLLQDYRDGVPAKVLEAAPEIGIAGPAFKTGDGTLLFNRQARSHFDLAERLTDEDTAKLDEHTTFGFMDTEGKFLTREEAHILGQKISPTYKQAVVEGANTLGTVQKLDSSDLEAVQKPLQSLQMAPPQMNLEAGSVGGNVPIKTGTSNLDASVEKNIADAKMMQPNDPVGFLKKMADTAINQGKQDVANNFQKAIDQLQFEQKPVAKPNALVYIGEDRDLEITPKVTEYFHKRSEIINKGDKLRKESSALFDQYLKAKDAWHAVDDRVREFGDEFGGVREFGKLSKTDPLPRMAGDIGIISSVSSQEAFEELKRYAQTKKAFDSAFEIHKEAQSKVWATEKELSSLDANFKKENNLTDGNLNYLLESRTLQSLQKSESGSIMPELNAYLVRAGAGGLVGGLIGGHNDTNGDTSGFVTGAFLGAIAASVGPEIAIALTKKLAGDKLPTPKPGLSMMGNLNRTFAQVVEDKAGAVIHGSSRVSDRLVSWFDKAFGATMSEAVKRTLRVAEGTATNLLDTADSAMRKLSVFYKVPEDIKVQANRYLDGELSRDEFLQELHNDDHVLYAKYVIAARESINGLQRMIASGIGSEGKAKMILDSLDQYVTRSYKLFTRDNWSPSVETVNGLVEKIKIEKSWQGASEEAIRDYLYSYIREVNSSKGMYRGSNSKIGQSIDQNVLKTRKDLSDEWRAFLGEVTNPTERISQTLYRLRPMAVASDFMHKIASTMEGEYFRSRSELDAYKATKLQQLQSATTDAEKQTLPFQISKLDNFQPVESLPKFGELRGGIVSRDVYNTLATYDSMTGLMNHPWMRSVAGLNVAAKLSNTALNPISFVRNVYQIPMMMAIGRASMNDVYEGFKILHDPAHPMRAEIISQGIGSVDQLKQEIFRDFNTATEGKFDISTMDASNLSLGRFDADVARKGFAKFANRYLDVYRSPDNAVRIGTYLSAKSRIAEALNLPLDHADVITKATDFTNRYTMDYGAIAPIIRNVRQVPGFNLYISYISEMTRISKNVIADIIGGAGDGITAHGRLYAALPIAFLGALPVVMDSLAESSLSPSDRKDWEKAKGLMPAYARDRFRSSITRDANGNFNYVDFTPLIPTDFIHQSVSALANGDFSALAAVNPVFALDNSPALNILTEQFTGRDVHTQRDFRGFSDRVASVAKEILPPWLSMGREGKKYEQSHTPTESGELGLTNLRTGQRLTPADFWLPYETALRTGGYNLSVLEQRATNDIKRELANNYAYLSDILKSDAAPEIKTREQLKFQKVYDGLMQQWQREMGFKADAQGI